MAEPAVVFGGEERITTELCKNAGWHVQCLSKARLRNPNRALCWQRLLVCVNTIKVRMRRTPRRAALWQTPKSEGCSGLTLPAELVLAPYSVVHVLALP